MNEHVTGQIGEMVEELFSGWTETNDGIRQRNGHPPADHTNILVSYFLDDLRAGRITIQASEESHFASVGVDVTAFMQRRR